MKKDNNIRTSITGIHYETGQPVRIEILGGEIVSVSGADRRESETRDLFIAPGLFDNQINGYAGIDFSGSDLDPDGVIRAASAIWKEGVTSFLPTLITGSHQSLIKNFAVLNLALAKDEQVAESVPGFHLEGPYISPEEGYRGCHPVQYIRKPSIREFEAYQQAAGQKIIQVTLAPELDGAGEFIRYCKENGIVTAMGHTEATGSEIAKAADEGVRLSTHLGNGCANFIHRHHNPIWPQLANEKLIPSIIADGHHLLPEELKVFLKVKGPASLILTSDVVYLAGKAPGKYIFLESEVELSRDGMLRNTALNCLAGASFPLKTGVANMMKITGCSMGEAINMASLNVARVYGLDDRGSLSAGKRADLILFEMDGEKLKIRKTYLNGKLVFTD